MRREGWEDRLQGLIAEAHDRAFAWGTWDCCRFACAAIAALTGDDPSEAYRGRYQDEGSGQALVRAGGGVRAIAERVAAARGFARIPVLFARRGDIVLGTIAGRDTLGVCAGREVLFAVAPRGLQPVPITDPALTAAWRIA